jgi:hypothetical protein
MGYEPLTDRYGHRGIQFDVRSIGDGELEWAFYPKHQSGIPAQRGRVNGTRAQAEAACRAAMDAALDERSPEPA